MFNPRLLFKAAAMEDTFNDEHIRSRIGHLGSCWFAFPSRVSAAACNNAVITSSV